jgi:twinkle protein
MNLESRALDLDEARKARILKSQVIDVEKYLHANDVTLQVKPATSWLESIKDNYLATDKPKPVVMPWPSTHSSFAFRDGEVTVYAGGNGGGKSLITGQIALHLVKQGQKVCIASFEMKPEKTLERMLRQFAGEYIDDPLTHNREAYITKLVSRLDKFLSDNMYLYDQQGSTSPDKVIAMARYCAVELGVKHIVIDSLMKCVKGEDDFNGQKNFVDELTALARDHSVHIHLIHHIRKLVNEEQQPNKHDLKGSGSISDQVDNVFLMWRNKKKENMKNRGEQVDNSVPDAFLMCEKQRNGEAQEWYNLWYHGSSQQFVDSPGSVPMDFDNKGSFTGA